MTNHDLLDLAIHTFIHGFAFTRSFTHPYLPEVAAGTDPPIWAVRDAPRKSGDYRTEEWVAHIRGDVTCASIDQLARRGTRGRFAICALHTTHEPDAPLRAEFKSLGYRLRTTEPMMVHSLKKISLFKPPPAITIERIQTQELADRLAKAARSRQILPEFLEDNAPLRQYVALHKQKPMGWVRSIVVTGNRGISTWCSNMFVERKYRRRGIARALLSRMLHDDRAQGAKIAILLSSHTGAMLYPVLGYEQIGTLLLFSPRKG